ncbi:MAG: hypothetical protein ACW99G_00290 [Candidatus Thorarchaeota archaeon]|jgi:hypothetical protein
MNYWLESSLEELYKSSVKAFPETRKRQYATNPVVVEKIIWTPFVGMKTLFVKGIVKNEGKEYNTAILFKGVSYHEEDSKGVVPLLANDEKEYYLEQLSKTDTDVLVRCNCPDFYWRFNYYNHLDKSLNGRHRAKYEAKYRPGSANPQKLPGTCKHLMKFMHVLGESRIIR